MHPSRRPAGFSRPDLHDWLVDHDPLVLVADRNDVLETLGHDPRSLATESTWLHRLGPSAMCAHRRLVTLLEAVGDGHAVPLKALASELGLPSGEGRNAKVVKPWLASSTTASPPSETVPSPSPSLSRPPGRAPPGRVRHDTKHCSQRARQRASTRG